MIFKAYLKESLSDTTGVAIDNEIIQFVLESFNLATQTHIFHLLTKSYAEHVAIGEFYEGLRDCIDMIAESSIGLDISVSDSNYANNLSFTYNKANLIAIITAYRSNVSNLIEASNDKSIMSINDKIIDVQKLIDTLLYKLQLS